MWENLEVALPVSVVQLNAQKTITLSQKQNFGVSGAFLEFKIRECK